MKSSPKYLFSALYLLAMTGLFQVSCQQSDSTESSRVSKIIGKDQRFSLRKPHVWVGSLSLKGHPGHCTAFAVSPHQIMTAAHCLLTGTEAGLYEFTNSEGSYQATQARWYPEADLAVLTVSNGTPFSHYYPVATTLLFPEGKQPYLISYDPVRKRLMKSETGEVTFITENATQTGIFTHRYDTTQGASGAPLILDKKVVGVHLGSLRSQDYNYGVMPAWKETAQINRHLTGINTEFSVFDDLLFGGAVLLGHSLSYGIKGVGQYISDSIKPVMIRRVLRSYLNGVELPEDCRKRLQEHINSPEMIEQIVPFLMTLSQIFQTPQAWSQAGFEENARKIWLNSPVPGLSHSLFSLKNPEPSSEASPRLALDKNLLAKVLMIYDVLFLQNPSFSIGTLTTVDPALLENTMPVVRNIIKELMSLEGGAHALKDIIAGLETLIQDEYRLEASTHSLATFVYRNIYKYHRMVESKKERIRMTQHRFGLLLESDPDLLLKELSAYQDSQKFAVHILVDGLQGHLMEALSSGNADHTFIQEIARDDREHTKFRPKRVASTEAPKQQHSFLHFLADNNFRHPDYLSFFRSLYQSNTAGIINQGVSTTPTISVRNLPIAQTGAPVTGEGSTNLPNFHFVHRGEDRAYYFYGNDSLALEQITQDHGMKTIAERLPGLGSMNCFGSYEAGFKTLFDPLLNLGLGESVRDFGEKLCLGELDRRASSQILLSKKIRDLMALESVLTEEEHWYDFLFPAKSIQKQNARYLLSEIARLTEDSLPGYLHYYNPWPDHFAHFAGPFSDEIIAPTGELNRLDYWLQKITDIYKKAGVLEKTLFGMSGDHGLAPNYYITHPTNILLKNLEAKGIHLISEKISSDEGEGPRISHPTKNRSMRGKDLVYASTAGGNLMYDFFKDQGEGWATQPLYRDLLHLKTLDGHEVNMIEAILEATGDSLGYMLVREEHTEQGQSVTRIIGPSPQGRETGDLVWQKGDRYFYQNNHNLLQVRNLSPYTDLPEDSDTRDRLLQKCLDQAEFTDESTWCTGSEWTTLTSYTPLPDSVVQVANLYACDLAGTVNLFPADGIGYNTVVPGRHAGEHFHEKDAFVGFWSADDSVSYQGDRSAVIGSVPATIYQYLSSEQPEDASPPMAYPGMLAD